MTFYEDGRPRPNPNSFFPEPQSPASLDEVPNPREEQWKRRLKEIVLIADRGLRVLALEIFRDEILDHLRGQPSHILRLPILDVVNRELNSLDNAADEGMDVDDERGHNVARRLLF